MTKHFIYVECQEGGSQEHHFSQLEEITNDLIGWMTGGCVTGDSRLIEWVDKADVGEYFEHRLGVAIRLKDKEDSRGEDLNTDPDTLFCSVCGEGQFETPSGLTCKNGHGGAPSKEDSQ